MENKERKVIVDVLLLAVILCAFFAGFLYGEKVMWKEMFSYINSSCECKEIEKPPYEGAINGTPYRSLNFLSAATSEKPNKS